jgi:hypothetical protein
MAVTRQAHGKTTGPAAGIQYLERAIGYVLP